MSLFKGSFSASFFNIVGNIPDGNFHDQLINQVMLMAFRAPADSAWAGVKKGWTDPNNPLVTNTFGKAEWICEPHVVLSMRIDAKRLPAKLFKAKLEIAISDWSKNHDGVTCPRSVRAEIKNALREDMLKQQQPKMSQIIAFWNIGKGTIVLDTTSKASQESFRSLFKETFAHWSLTVEPHNPLKWANAEHKKLLAGVVSQPLTDPEVRDQLSLQYEKMPPFGLTEEFLAWVAYMTRSGDWPSRHGGAVAGLEVWVDDKIAFADEKKNKVSVSGEGTSGSKASLAALAKGQMPQELRLGVRRNEYEWSVVIKGTSLDWSGTRLPAGDSDEWDDMVHERASLIAALQDAISVLVTLFCAVRANEKWQAFRENMRAWAEGQDDGSLVDPKS